MLAVTLRAGFRCAQAQTETGLGMPCPALGTEGVGEMGSNAGMAVLLTVGVIAEELMTQLCSARSAPRRISANPSL